MSEHHRHLESSDDAATGTQSADRPTGNDKRRAAGGDGSADVAHSLVALAREPALIPAIYEACDQWCDYCRVTDRCLAFRSTNAAEMDCVFDPVCSDGEAVADGAALLKTLAKAEGRLAPPEIDAVLSGDPERLREVFDLDDPLERLGRRYMMLSEAYLQSQADFPPERARRPEGPSALEVLAWFQVLAPARVFRSILCDAEARRGIRGRRTDTLRAAKVALIGLDRSASAIENLQLTDDDPRLELMLTLVRQLREAVEARFGGARRYIRQGLDADPPRRFGLDRGLRRLRTMLRWR